MEIRVYSTQSVIAIPIVSISSSIVVVETINSRILIIFQHFFTNRKTLFHLTVIYVYIENRL